MCRMLRHIIVEGPDGSGKDGLVSRLAPLFPQHKLHEKASTSLGGPVPFLTTWVDVDLRTVATAGPWIYNRHPLVSEPIYAPIARQTVPQGSFADPDWVALRRIRMAEHALMVWCLPPWSVVRHNVCSGPIQHMRGVAEHIRDLYTAYRKAAGNWPGRSLYWDYTSGNIHTFAYIVNEALMT